MVTWARPLSRIDKSLEFSNYGNMKNSVGVLLIIRPVYSAPDNERI